MRGSSVFWGGLISLLSLVAVSANAAPEVPTAEQFGRPAALSQVSISPDGKHIAALSSVDGKQVTISVWRPDALSDRTVIGATRMRFLGVSFLKNDRLLVEAIQPITSGFVKGHVRKQYVTDLTGSAWKPLLPESRAGQSEGVALEDRLLDAQIISFLPLDPVNVLAEDQRVEGRGDVYRINIYTGAAERIERGSERFGDYRADLKGELRSRIELNYDGGKVYLAQWFKNPDNGRWEEHFRSYAKDRVIRSVVGFSTDPNVAYVSAPLGDKLALFEYDIRQRKFLEPVFAHKLFDVGSSLSQSSTPSDYGQVIGFSLLGPRHQTYWVDDQLASIANGLKQALAVKEMALDWTDPGGPQTATITLADGADADIVSWSNDRSLMIVEKSGPSLPPEYYLLSNGSRLQPLGKGQPWLDPAALGTSRLVEYRARDGQMIPAFLTVPPKALYGPGPYPTLIEPHGGPWARDELTWDVPGFVQYFASHGYAVLQPQFRGSEGWGQALWRAGDGEWGQKMQDDKDDGVRWLVAQGIADPRRVAMFGYSYGGYAALAAAVRPNGLYQCAISGAGAGDLGALERATFDNRFQREFQHPTIKGLDVLDHAKEAQIPLFLYHGDRDQIVDVEQSRKFASALKSAGKPHRYLEIADMGHTLDTWEPSMWTLQLSAIDDFLKTGCKAGGL